MRRYLPLVALVALVAAAGTVVWVGRHSSSPANAAQLATQRQLANLTVASPIRHANLAIFPILSRHPQSDDKYVTLDEGLATGTVEIYEVGSDGNRIVANAAGNNAAPNQQAANLDLQANAGVQVEPQGSAQVNRLMLVNRSGKPLYLMPGEVVIGGSQDRTIAQERVIASNNEPVSLDVFCVEHGRWGGRGREGNEALIAGMNRASFVASGEAGVSVNVELTEAVSNVRQLAAKADSGRFIVGGGNLNKAARLAVQGSREQQAVWDEVAQTVEKTSKFVMLMDVVSRTGSFSATSASGELASHLEPYQKTLQAPISETENVVGVVVAINGKVESFDVFESTPLFRKLWPKLLKSYALDAATMADSEGTRTSSTASVANARTFFRKTMLADATRTESTADGLDVDFCLADGAVRFCAGFSRNDEGDYRAPLNGDKGSGGDGFGGSIHACGFSCDINPNQSTGNAPAAILSGRNRGDTNRNPARMVTDAFTGE